MVKTHTPVPVRFLIYFWVKKKRILYLSCYYVKFLPFATPCNSDAPLFHIPLRKASSVAGKPSWWYGASTALISEWPYHAGVFIKIS